MLRIKNEGELLGADEQLRSTSQLLTGTHCVGHSYPTSPGLGGEEASENSPINTSKIATVKKNCMKGKYMVQ